MLQRFNCFTGSIGGNGLIDSRAQLLQGFDWCKDSIGSRVQLDQMFNWLNGSINSGVQLVQGFNWFKGSIASKAQLLQGFIGSGVQLAQFVQG